MAKKVKKGPVKNLNNSLKSSRLYECDNSNDYGLRCQNKFAPLLKLPSPEVCIANTQPISCIKSNSTLKSHRGIKLIRTSVYYDIVDLCAHNSFDDFNGHSYAGVLSDEVTRNDVGTLNGQLYLMSLLNRIIKLGFCNKRQILSLYNFGIRKNSVYHFNFINKNIIKTLIKSSLSKVSSYRCSKGALYSSLTPVDSSFGPNNIVCFDNSTFSLLDTFLIHSKSFMDNSLWHSDCRTGTCEDEKLSSLLKGKLCNGKDSTAFNKLILSILLVNRYDFLSPKFTNLMLSTSRIRGNFR